MSSANSLGMLFAALGIAQTIFAIGNGYPMRFFNPDTMDYYIAIPIFMQCFVIVLMCTYVFGERQKRDGTQDAPNFYTGVIAATAFAQQLFFVFYYANLFANHRDKLNATIHGIPAFKMLFGFVATLLILITLTIILTTTSL